MSETLTVQNEAPIDGDGLTAENFTEAYETGQLHDQMYEDARNEVNDYDSTKIPVKTSKICNV